MNNTLLEEQLITCINYGGPKNIDQAKVLLAKYPDLELNLNHIYNGNTALSAAVTHVEVEIIDLLLAHKKIDVNLLITTAKDEFVTAAQIALRRNNQNGVIRLVRDPRFDPNIRNSAGETVFGYILCFRQLRLLLHLLASDKELKPSQEEINLIRQKLAEEHNGFSEDFNQALRWLLESLDPALREYIHKRAQTKIDELCAAAAAEE